jgi:hypothetical protein
VDAVAHPTRHVGIVELPPQRVTERIGDVADRIDEGPVEIEDDEVIRCVSHGAHLIRLC